MQEQVTWLEEELMALQRETRRRLAYRIVDIRTSWLAAALIGLLLILSSCGGVPQSSHAAQTDTHRRDKLRELYKFPDPNNWIWRAGLPYNRLVVFYGNPFSPVMGPIGQYSDDELLIKLRKQAQAYATLDPTHPVVPAFDYVTPVVQSVATYDSSWVYRMPSDSIEHYLNLANSHHMLFFMDMQIGHSSIQKEVNILWPYLQPGVQLVTCVDGFGTPGEKIDDYRIFDNQQLIQYPGFKLFYKLDKPLMSPADVLALDPPPL